MHKVAPYNCIMKHSCWSILVAVLASSVSSVEAFAPSVQYGLSRRTRSSTSRTTPLASSVAAPTTTTVTDEISAEHPLQVLIAGAGVGGLALAASLCKHPHMNVTVLEQTASFKRFGGPIQLASNALQLLQDMDESIYEQVQEKFTVTGDKENGIKDGIRTEWYAKFDLASPAEDRNLPYTGVIDRPDLQEIYLQALPKGTVHNGDGVASYEHVENGRVQANLKSGQQVSGDVLIGADGIWSSVRATMRGTPAKGEGSGASYSGYTVFAGELKYDSPDNGKVGYKVYIGPGQYFVITDIGNGNYQWYAFLAKPVGATFDKPNNSTSEYLQQVFAGWSPECHAILKVTKENEIEQRDLYDRPPSVLKPWTDGPVALLGDGIHAMMPNLGQGGCQAIEDAYVIAEELETLKSRKQVTEALKKYQGRRLIRSAAVQGLSRFASDIIIRGFDTPAKIVKDEETGKVRFENFNYAGIVTKLLQPILPIFFMVQFNFLYDGYKNKKLIDVPATVGFTFVGGLVLLIFAFEFAQAGIGLGIGAEALLGAEGVLDADVISTAVREMWPF